MKKFFLFSLIALFIIGISSISFASVDKAYEAAVINVNGEVKVDPNADGGWFTPWVGMKLKKGAVIKVGGNSSRIHRSPYRNQWLICRKVQCLLISRTLKRVQVLL